MQEKKNIGIIRKNKKSITHAKKLKTTKMKIIKRRTLSQSPFPSISTQVLDFDTFTTYVHQLNQKGVAVLPQKEPKVAHLTKLDLNKLFNESKDSLRSDIKKKPNYLMKSMFLGVSKSLTPTRTKSNTNVNLVYQYFGDSLIQNYPRLSHFFRQNKNNYYYIDNEEEDDLNDKFILEKEESEEEEEDTIFNTMDDSDNFSQFTQTNYSNEGYYMNNRDDFDSNYMYNYQNMNIYEFYRNNNFSHVNNNINYGGRENNIGYIDNFYSRNYPLRHSENHPLFQPQNTLNQMSYQNKINNYNSFSFSVNQGKMINQNYNLLSENELLNQMHIIVKYQSGCRYLQRKIDENPSIIDTIYFPNVLQHIHELSIDQYGVLFIQRIFKHLTEEQLLQFIAILYPTIVQIAENVNGANLIIDLINFLNSDHLLNAFLKVIIPNILHFIRDQNACQIIHKLLSIKANQDIIDMFFQEILNKITEVCKNKKGCAFIQKCLGELNERLLYQLFDALEKNLSVIITNQYGNYIIQSVLSHKFPSKQKMYKSIIHNFVFYSNQKYSSNVVERCFDEPEVRDEFINELAKEDHFKAMLMDSYGNYVVQRAIITANEEQKTKLFILLVPLIPQLQTLSYGQKLLSKLLIQNPKLAMVMFKLNQ